MLTEANDVNMILLTKAIVTVITKVSERNLTLLVEAIATAFTDAITPSQIIPLDARTPPTDVKTQLQRLFFARLVTLKYTGVNSI